ncbi:MAG TPA: hypothetical protein VK427_09965 [Kofleriaceae bacterium]|nr:hypothetical protein [Kofleriaceae bacterium]
MPFSFAQVHTFALKLPDVTVGTKWRNRTWLVGDRGFAWERPLGKADIKRYGDTPHPTGQILGVMTENLDAKDALLAMDLAGFFTIEHFKNYPAVLVELRRAKAADVRAALVEAHRAVAMKKKTRKSNLVASAPKRRAQSGVKRTQRN